MSEINKTSQQSLHRILDKIGVKSANEKRKTYKQFKGDLKYAKQTPLKRGEYRVFDKKTGKYMSNK